MARSRKRASQWVAIDDGDYDAPPATFNFSHTELNLDKSGSSSIRTSHLETLTSPTKKGRHSEQDTGSWITEPQLELPDFGDDLDPAYTEECIEYQMETPARKKENTRCKLFYFCILSFSPVTRIN